MILTPHFTLDEFERSDAAARQGIDNRVPEALMPNLWRLCDLLEDLRKIVGPIHVSSGYRCLQLNTIIGGAQNSAHLEARAADINVEGIKPRALAGYIAASTLPFDKVLMEFGEWVHIQVERAGEEPRRQVFTARRGANGTEYVQGLEG